MWLVNTETLQLEYFLNHETVRYAILSHTWENDEVSHQEFRGKTVQKATGGLNKIAMTCQLARTIGIPYAWIDTCCIDKSSSAELSEAINSMFRWYRDAAICFVYLSDVYMDDEGRTDGIFSSGFESEFSRCKWFTRGWTLQELVAPKNITFYDRGWKSRGSKESLITTISKITLINPDILSNSDLLDSVPVARRMSWAARRQTTRPEDLAYCLLGIFDINMPMLYGEGHKAFLRLQEEICRRSRDLTLFAWEAATPVIYHGLFARHPRDFSSASKIDRNVTRTPYTKELRLTNKGVCLEEMELRFSPEQGLLLDLGCYRPQSHQEGTVHIRLAKTMDGYVRRDANRLFVISRDPNLLLDVSRNLLEWRLPESVYIPGTLTTDDFRKLEHQSTHLVRIKIPAPDKIKVLQAFPSEFWDPHQSAFLMGCTSNGVGEYLGLIELTVKGEPDVKLILMFHLFNATPDRRIISFGHTVVDDQWHQYSDVSEWLRTRTSRNIRTTIQNQFLHTGNAQMGEGCFGWTFWAGDAYLELNTNVRKTSKDKGQAWSIAITC
ncbi:heterokaryon incompatibility protein-domain-containing protein [Xylariales sp. AK1849]|nr:heterokaryon incompatibility protein-domain-containing protein [Xylariales sp. AK1849]